MEMEIFMNTIFLLMAEFNTGVVPLSLISEKYFGLAPGTARDRATANRLPIRAWRESQKCEYLVSLIDLAYYIDEKRKEATL
ncbi:pyocin activator protein PrtN [Vibrio cincinnatiensis]|nr:pyocin activator protein PrtN [Vibrio cincinnatiensis]MCG3762536.1 pyocin activator protein PrtN [Vibrio cincinnatiensis]